MAGEAATLQAALHIQQRAVDETGRTLLRVVATRRNPRGNYAGAYDLEADIYDYLLLHNTKPKPSVWTKDILARERRALDAFA